MAGKIEVMTMEDYDEVLALWERSDGVVVSEADSPENIQKYLLRNPHSCFVARENGRVTGAVLCGHDGRRGLLHHLAIDPADRRKGIGKALVDQCMAQLKIEGIYKCYIIVLSENKSGQEFWKSLGWADFGGRATVLGKVV